MPDLKGKTLVDFTVGGITGLKVPEPFDEGHICTAGEASALNQTYKENVRNACADKVKANPADAQAIITEYCGEYEFGVRRARAQLNPVEYEARQIAISLVKAALKKKGLKPSEYEGYDDKVSSVMADPAVVQQAEKIVAAKTSDGGDVKVKV